jgi:hypothetical protein
VTSPDAPSPPRGERWAAAALTAFGIAASVEAWKLPFGGLTQPAAGFFPLCLAVALTLVAAIVLLRALRGRAGEAAVGAGVAAPGGVVRAAATLGALGVYALALEPVGFGVATLLLTIFLFRAIEPQPWPVALGGAAAAVLACHVLFRVWLGVRLPVGPWGF